MNSTMIVSTDVFPHEVYPCAFTTNGQCEWPGIAIEMMDMISKMIGFKYQLIPGNGYGIGGPGEPNDTAFNLVINGVADMTSPSLWKTRSRMERLKSSHSIYKDQLIIVRKRQTLSEEDITYGWSAIDQRIWSLVTVLLLFVKIYRNLMVRKLVPVTSMSIILSNFVQFLVFFTIGVALELFDSRLSIDLFRQPAKLPFPFKDKTELLDMLASKKIGLATSFRGARDLILSQAETTNKERLKVISNQIKYVNFNFDDPSTMITESNYYIISSRLQTTIATPDGLCGNVDLFKHDSLPTVGVGYFFRNGSNAFSQFPDVARQEVLYSQMEELYNRYDKRWAALNSKCAESKHGHTKKRMDLKRTFSLVIPVLMLITIAILWFMGEIIVSGCNKMINKNYQIHHVSMNK